MTTYPLILTLHGIFVLALAAGIGIEAWMLLLLRRTGSPHVAERLSAPLPGLIALGMASLAAVHLSGVYLTSRLEAWHFAWPKLAVVGVLIVAILGVLSAVRLRTMRRSCATPALSDKWDTNPFKARFLKLSLSVRTWVVCGTLLLTAVKPNVFWSIGVVAVAALLGCTFAFLPFGALRMFSPDVATEVR